MSTDVIFRLIRRHPLLVPLALVLAINTISLFTFANVGTSVGADLGTDGYKEIAESIVNGDGFTNWPGRPSTMMSGSMKREPVYPLWLSGILATTGSLNPEVLWVFQTSLSLLSCWLLYRLSVRSFGARTGIVATYIYALHPISFWYTTRFASEIVAIPVLLLCLLTIDRFFREFTPQTALWSGVSLGVAALTKSAFVILLPLVVLFALMRRHQRRAGALCAVVLICSFLAVDSLWLFRNYRISGAIVPFTTMNGVIFFVGNKIVDAFEPAKLTAGGEPERWAEGLYRAVQTDIATATPDMSFPRLEAETDKRLRTMARDQVLRNPSFVFRKVVKGLVFIWFLSDSSAKSWGWAAFQLPLLMLAIIGICGRHSWNPGLLLLLMFTALFLVAYALVSPYARYALPVFPIVILFASDGLATLAKWPFALRTRAVDFSPDGADVQA